MLLSITTTHSQANDLGYLLVKHPDRLHTRDVAYGRAHVFFPEATAERCTATLLLEVDPVGLVRGSSARPDFVLRQYVNDRPYTANSLLSMALAKSFSTAMAGRSKDRPELAAKALPLSACLETLPCRGGEALLRRLFEPLGYRLTAERLPLDARFPEWGGSNYYRVQLDAEIRLCDLLSHLYVLMPVLDDDKHYWVGTSEVDKLLERGESWLPQHPEKELIAQRYLRHQRSLTRDALARLSDGESESERDAEQQLEEENLERPMRLHDIRLDQVRDVLVELAAVRVLDLGCGDGKLLARLVRQRQFQQIVGVDVSHQALEVATRRLRLDPAKERQRERIQLLQGSLVYRDERIQGFDAAAVVEVIEHLEPSRLPAFEDALFGQARPGAVVLTTPNAEYNALFENLPAGKFRHRDHRFEWRRDEFTAWAERVCADHGYEVEVRGVGPEDEACGAPSQMGLFRRCD